MQSYAQVGNDIIAAFLLGKSEGVSYIDIGCLFPVSASNTYYFYKRGGKGLCIDPNPQIAEQFKAERPNDIFVNVGVGAEAGELRYNMYANPVYNTFSEDQAAKVAKKGRKGAEKFQLIDQRIVPVLPLNQIVASNGFAETAAQLDFLTIDAEGYEEKIIGSIDFERVQPTVICLECIVNTSLPMNIYDNRIAKMLSGKGYHVAAFTGHDLYLKKTAK